MADTKISADATVTPAGADFIPIVQGGANKKATLDSLPIPTLVTTALNDKVDKVTGKSLVLDTVITDLTDGGETTLHSHPGGSGSGIVETVVAGTKISVDDTDPANPVVSLSLGADDNFVTDAEKTVIGNTSGANSGDQDLSGLVPYTGATGDVNLGTNSISAESEAITGTGGAGFITLASQSSNPTAPSAGTLLLHSSTNNGFTRLEQDNEAATNLVLGRDSVFIAKNTSGSTINKGQVVYVTGSTGNVPNIGLARANAVSTLPCIGIAVDSISNNAFGQIMHVGILSGIDTSAYTTGDSLFVSPSSAGGLTNVRPTGTSANYAQRIGSVLVSGVGNGSITVLVAPAVLNMESGTTAATFTTNAIQATTIKITTGAGLGKVLTSDADGDATWETPSAGGGSSAYQIADYSGQAVIGILGRLDINNATTLNEISLISDTLPVGSNLILEARKNSTTSGNIFSSTVQITTSESVTNGRYIVSTTGFTSASLADGDVVYFYLTSVGSTTAAINPRVIVR